MEVSQGPDFSGDPFDVRIMNELTLTSLKNPACRKQNRGGTQIFSCISDMLASGAEGHADVLGAHICTG